MNEAPNQQFIEDLAIELGVESAFLEKDWYAVQLLKHIFNLQSELKCEFVFTGGTSLSKGHNMLDRFSEDIDLLILDNEDSNKASRSNLRKKLVKLVDVHECFKCIEESEKAFDKNRSFEFLVSYPALFPQSTIRKHLKVDLQFKDSYLPAVEKPIISKVSQYQQLPAETSTLCVSPIEIAADKLSALSWKVHSHEKYEPTVLRHLHDLAWLEDIIKGNPKDFVKSVELSFYNDQGRWCDELKNLSTQDKFESVIKLLEEKSSFAEDYRSYVLDFSYSKDEDKISYDNALKTIISLL